MNHDTTNPHLSEDLLEVARAVDALALSERTTPVGLEDRVIAATTPRLRSAIGHDARPSARILHTNRSAWRFFSPIRMAAAVALLSAASLVYLASHKAHTGAVIATTEQPKAVADIEYWLALAPADDPVDAELDLLKIEAEQVRQGIHNPAPADGGAL